MDGPGAPRISPAIRALSRAAALHAHCQMRASEARDSGDVEPKVGGCPHSQVLGFACAPAVSSDSSQFVEQSVGDFALSSGGQCCPNASLTKARLGMSKVVRSAAKSQIPNGVLAADRP